MCMYHCCQCGSEESTEPEITISYPKRVLDPLPHVVDIYDGGFYYKPKETSDEEWRGILLLKQREKRADKLILVHDNSSLSFCSTSCASNYLSSQSC